MGMNTTIFICNDALHEIERNPEKFVKELVEAIQYGTMTTILGQTTVMPTAHADQGRLYYTRANSITEISGWNKDVLKKYEEASVEVRKIYRTMLMSSFCRVHDLKNEFDGIDEEEGVLHLTEVD